MIPITDAHPSVVIRPEGPDLSQGRDGHVIKCFLFMQYEIMLST